MMFKCFWHEEIWRMAISAKFQEICTYVFKFGYKGRSRDTPNKCVGEQKTIIF